jgi:hypothetical protein
VKISAHNEAGFKELIAFQNAEIWLSYVMAIVGKRLCCLEQMYKKNVSMPGVKTIKSQKTNVFFLY